ncbi:MAG: coproporphyrinogen dehydrogenase HemZ [Bacillota bacterium]|nr:coproporphyrinogen dehydrogenase HemZ [Bacillota bacterium]
MNNSPNGARSVQASLPIDLHPDNKGSNMPLLYLIGHTETFAAADLLRLFFGDPVREVTGVIHAGLDQTILVSRLEQPADTDSLQDKKTVCIMTDIESIHLSGSVTIDAARREIKRQLYQALSEWTGRSYPWGSLTGIRPTLIAAECLAQMTGTGQARQKMTDYWLVSAEKADLAIATAMAEQEILAQIPENSLFVYIGIPFCPSRCSYCSFITRDAPAHAALLDPYVDAVIHEARSFFDAVRQPVSALYIGGGTPTSLSAAQLQRLLYGVLPHIPLLPGAELTVEAGRPDTIDAARLSVLRAAGTNRICINPQTFHDSTLIRIGRQHTVRQMLDAWQLARSMGFDRINIDLIAGLPGEKPADLAFSVQEALALRPAGLTLHALAPKRSSDLHDTISGQASLQTQPEWNALLTQLRHQLAEAGLYPYYLYRQKQAIGGLENTGFARLGCACRYNVGMMSDRHAVVGIGSGSISKKITDGRLERLANPRNIAVYLQRIDELARKKQEWFRDSGP